MDKTVNSEFEKWYAHEAHKCPSLEDAFKAGQRAPLSALSEKPQSDTPNYKVLWERDSSALGRCLQDIHNLRALSEDRRAKIVCLERELSDLRAKQSFTDQKESK